MAKPSKAARAAEHEKAIQRTTEAADTGFVVYAHPELGYARVRVTYGTTISVGGEGNEHWEAHPEASESIGTTVPVEDDGTVIVLPLGMAMQYEALGQVEILERLPPTSEGDGE